MARRKSEHIDPIEEAFQKLKPLVRSVVKGKSVGKQENVGHPGMDKLIAEFNTLTDHADRQRLEIERLKNELEFTKLVAEENPNPILQFSVEKKAVVYLNAAGRHLLSALSRTEKRIIVGDWRKDMEECVRSKKSFSRELHIKKLGSIYMCTMVPAYHHVNVYATDVTPIKQAEEEISRLSFAIDESNNAVIIADRTGRIQWVNKGFERVTGYSLDDVRGTRGEILRKGKHTGLSDDSPFYKKVLESGQSVSYESRNFRKDGSDYWTLSTLTPLLDEEKDLVSIIAVDSDITDKKKNEQELYEAKEQAEKSNKAKEIFLANMSHEIRTPMNAIMGIIQLLKETDLNGEQREYLRSMNFASENLLRIINDVLDLSKIESGKMSIEKVPFNIKELLRDLISSIEHRASERGLTLTSSFGENLPDTLIGDPVRLNQVILNLLSNSIKFTETGSIKLSADGIERKDNKVVIEFVIEDTGIGIPESMHELIFGAFEQVQRSNKAKYGGTGLGLSIVKRIIDLHQGSIQIKSVEDEGTTFTCRIPFEYKESEKTTSSMGEEFFMSDLLNGKRALLVEDNTLNQLVAKKFLASFGLEVGLAADGLEALAMMKKHSYDLVLMDIQMPNMDGYETVREMRNQKKLKNVPVVAMTAHAIQGEEEKCLSAGMNAYISKPINKRVLFEALKDLLKSN